MPNSQQGIATPADSDTLNYDCIACPFCGLHCDDLVVSTKGGEVRVVENGCTLAKAGFERTRPQASPQIGGKDATLDAAINAALTHIKSATLPLFGGLGTDVEGMRAIMALADKAGGVVDHALSAGLYRNTGVLQTKGWFMSTLSEARNRADLIVIVGADLSELHPRFFERILSPAETMFGSDTDKRTIVLIGAGDGAAAKITGGRIGDLIDIPCPPDQLPAVLGNLRAVLKDVPHGSTAANVSAEQLRSLADRMKAASYGVVVWAPQALEFDGADLVVQMISDIVRDMNKTTRFAGLSLGGNDGGASAAAVCSWQSGYPLRVSFASGAPDYDPYRYDMTRMLSAGEGDLLFWVSSINPHVNGPPATSIPTIVLGTPGIALDRTPDVFIPVGTPGIDHSGRLVRCDNVVSLPLRQLRTSEHARVRDVAQRIVAGL